MQVARDNNHINGMVVSIAPNNSNCWATKDASPNNAHVASLQSSLAIGEFAHVKEPIIIENDVKTKCGMIIDSGNSFITITISISPCLEKSSMEANNLLQARESKASAHEELRMSKNTAHIEVPMVDDIAFIFPTSVILSDTMSMSCNSDFIFHIRHRQIRNNNVTRYHARCFPEECESFYVFRAASQSRSIWKDLSHINLCVLKLQNSRSESLGGLGDVLVSTRASEACMMFLKSNTRFASHPSE